MIVEKSTISYNDSNGGDDTVVGIYEYRGGYAFGGGISAGGPTTITDSTISSNEAHAGDGCAYGGNAAGGGIGYELESLIITNCTVSNNKTIPGSATGDCLNFQSNGDSQGGGIYFSHFSSSTTMISSTVCFNSAQEGPFQSDGIIEGGGIYSSNQTVTVSINNSIISNNSTDGEGPDIFGEITSQDYNLIYDTSGGTILGNTNHNIYSQDPLLGCLDDNGGPTKTHSLRTGSPAIDAGSSYLNPYFHDQRGVARPYDDPGLSNAYDGCDIGAYEVNNYVPQSADVVINELAWSGTDASIEHEWIELYNRTSSAIDLTNWSLTAQDGAPIIALSDIIAPRNYFLIERNADTAISDLTANLIYTAEILSDSGEQLQLFYNGTTTIDTANNNGGQWPGGNASGFYSMERINPYITDIDTNWTTNNGIIRNGLDANSNPINGTPTSHNSQSMVSLGDYVWKDTDGDGIQDTGETGLESIVVRLLYDYGLLLAETTTDNNGFFQFENVLTGSYYLEFIIPRCYVLSPQDQGGDDTLDSDVDPVTGRTALISLSPQTQDMTWDAGMVWECGSLGNYVWLDDNLDGIQDVPETGLINVQVNLLDASSTVIETTYSDADGLYLFDEVLPGDYYIEFILPPDFGFSPQDQGSNDTLDSDANQATGRTELISLTPQQNETTWDSGMTMLDNSIGNYVWFDADADGIQDTTEGGLPHVWVSLYNQTYGFVEKTLSDIDGLYSFEDIQPGEYYLDFRLPQGCKFSPQDQGSDDTIDSDAEPISGVTANFTITSISQDPTWDAGMICPQNSLGNRVWIDTDMDGVQDNGESGISNVLVKLLDDTLDIVDIQFTDLNGEYLFTDFSPGNYYIEFQLPHCYTFSPQDQGSDDTLDSDPDPITGRTQLIAISTQANDMSWDAGMILPQLTWTLVTVCDTSCDFTTIQSAIDAITTQDCDIIRIDNPVHTEENIIVNKSITIQGHGPTNTIVQAHQYSGGASHRVFTIEPFANAILKDMTIRHGDCEFSACGGSGGGIKNSGVLALVNCDVTTNRSISEGGGILNVNVLSIHSSFVGDNTSTS